MNNGKRVYESILDLVGGTPLVRLNRVTSGVSSAIYAKLEFMNPTGSVKDRAALHMIRAAEADGRLKAGQLIIESSSGNMAMGLALAAIQLGYKLRVVVRDSLSREKMDMLLALGVEIITVDSSLPPESPDSYNNITPKLAAETPDCYFPDQHNNRENNESHYQSTGPEIWEQMEGKIDCFVAGMGTGGTIGGVGRFLKEKDPSIKVIAADPEGSIFHDYFYTGKRTEPAPYLIEGLGDEFPIGCADFSVIDRIIRVSDRDAFMTCRDLVKLEGVLAGGSSGAALWAAMKVAGESPKPLRIVTVFPDSAFRYLSTVFNDDWLKSHGF